MTCRNLSLRLALAAHPERNYHVAQQAGITPDRLSKFQSGLASPKDTEKKNLADVLKRPVDEIFPREKLGA